MPAGDRTGPLGHGPMTGRGAGYCAEYGAPGYANAGFGRGRGFGGGGRGWRNRFYATGLPGWSRGYRYGPGWTGFESPGMYGEFTPEREVEFLKGQAESFRRQIEVLDERIRELEDIRAKKGGADE